MTYRPRIGDPWQSLMKFSLFDHLRKNDQSSARQQEHVEVDSTGLEASQEVEEEAEVLHRYLVICHVTG